MKKIKTILAILPALLFSCAGDDVEKYIPPTPIAPSEPGEEVVYHKRAKEQFDLINQCYRINSGTTEGYMFRRIHLQCHVEIGTTAPLIPVCFPVFCVQAYFQQIIEKVKICIDAPRIVFTVVTNCDTFLILCHNSSIYFSCMAAAREVDNMALGECSFIQKFTVPVGGCT